MGAGLCVCQIKTNYNNFDNNRMVGETNNTLNLHCEYSQSESHTILSLGGIDLYNPLVETIFLNNLRINESYRSSSAINCCDDFKLGNFVLLLIRTLNWNEGRNLNTFCKEAAEDTCECVTDICLLVYLTSLLVAQIMSSQIIR